MNGKFIRINQLKNSKGFFLFIAMDHQLTVGYKKSLTQFEKWINKTDGAKNKISGLILNRGGLNKINSTYSNNIIPQIIGAPSLNGNVSKTKIMSLKTALAFGANAISVQINFEEIEYLKQVKKVANIIDEANTYGLPVLIMVNIKNIKEFNTSIFLDYIKRCEELGADLIKINAPYNLSENIKKTISSGSVVRCT